MPTIGRRDLVLFLIGLCPGTDRTDSELGGMTRLQKYLFLLEKEANLKPSGDGFGFEPYKAGPYSAKLYDDLEFLENIGLLESESTGSATAPERAELEKLTFDDLMGESAEESEDAFGERRFRLTPAGVERVRKLLAEGTLNPVADGVKKLKARYGGYSLSDLLYHVYTKYPEMAEESEIRDHVLKRGRGS